MCRIDLPTESTVLTTILSSTPTEQLRTRRVIAWALDGVLCRLHLTGSAATVARFKYREQVSVGDGCRLAIADVNTYTYIHT